MARWFAVFVSALLALCAGNALAQAAYLHNLNGSATASTGGTQRALKIGDLLGSGTVVTTGEKSNAVIKFEDGQVMMLGENSSFRIVEYRYNKQRVADSSAVFDLLRGGLRFVTGMIGSTNRNSFRLTAGAATIGIRGSSAIVHFDAQARRVLLAVTRGSLQMATQDGNVVANAGDFSTFVPGTQPTIPQSTAQADAAIQTILAPLLAQIAPVNRPVVLQDSAAAAAAVAQARVLAAQAAADPNNQTLKQAAQDAAKLAQEAVLKAIQSAQLAFEEGLKGGGIEPDPDTQLIPDGATQYQLQQLITPGGTPCSLASCN
jgi:FecR protein